MRPSNWKRRPLLLLDNAPVRCHFYARGEAGPPDFGIDECQADATVKISYDEWVRFDEWKEQFPNAIIGIRGRINDGTYLCDVHYDLVDEMMGLAEPVEEGERVRG